MMSPASAYHPVFPEEAAAGNGSEPGPCRHVQKVKIHDGPQKRVPPVKPLSQEHENPCQGIKDIHDDYLRYPGALFYDAEKKQEEGKKQEKKHRDGDKKKNNLIFPEKIKNVFSYSFHRGPVALVHAAFDMFGNIEKTGVETHPFCETGHVNVFAGFFPEMFTASYFPEYGRPDSDKLPYGRREQAGFCKTVEKKGNEEGGKHEHKGNGYDFPE
jgi:hypothetical protein